jgi:hypothetical protein
MILPDSQLDPCFCYLDSGLLDGVLAHQAEVLQELQVEFPQPVLEQPCDQVPSTITQLET